MVVKGSEYSTSTPTIRVRILLKSTIFCLIFLLKTTKINKKLAEVDPIKKRYESSHPQQKNKPLYRMNVLFMKRFRCAHEKCFPKCGSFETCSDAAAAPYLFRLFNQFFGWRNWGKKIERNVRFALSKISLLKSHWWKSQMSRREECSHSIEFVQLRVLRV